MLSVFTAPLSVCRTASNPLIAAQNKPQKDSAIRILKPIVMHTLLYSSGCSVMDYQQ